MNLRIPLKPVNGYNKIFDIGEYRMELTNFGLIKLAKGETYASDTKETEVALVLIGGNFKAECATAESRAPAGGRLSESSSVSTGGRLSQSSIFEVTDGRTSPFTGKPHCLYMPRHTGYVITALSDVELAFQSSPVTRDTAKPTLIRPEDTRHIALGRDNWTRTSEIILDEKFDSEHFYIGEGMIPSGNWSGYPSHRHDVNNPPNELDMEETYFYLFDRATAESRAPADCATAESRAPVGGRLSQSSGVSAGGRLSESSKNEGFGFQSVYTPAGTVAKKFGERLNEAYRVENYDTVAIAEGYHPLAGAPGYNMYYLWTMAGSQGRGLISSMDPAHAWVKGN